MATKPSCPLAINLTMSRRRGSIRFSYHTNVPAVRVVLLVVCCSLLAAQAFSFRPASTSMHLTPSVKGLRSRQASDRLTTTRMNTFSLSSPGPGPDVTSEASRTFSSDEKAGAGAGATGEGSFDDFDYMAVSSFCFQIWQI